MKFPLSPMLLQSPIQGREEVSAYSSWMCGSRVSGSNVKEFPSIFSNATAKESNSQKKRFDIFI